MNKTLNKVLRYLLPAVFWLGVWELAALAVGSKFLLPDIAATAVALWEVVSSEGFFLTVLMTLLRVCCGLALGIAAGILLAFAAHRFPAVKHLLTPLISVIKSTPVASFIIILWIMLSGDMLTVFIAFLMVLPIIWQNLMNGFAAIDRDLDEVCRVFEFSYFKKLRVLILPTLMGYFIPAVITSVGLAWKSEIAAEIIAYTKNSIGQNINDAKFYFDTPTVFAWTLIVILLSIALERITGYAARRIKK